MAGNELGVAEQRGLVACPLEGLVRHLTRQAILFKVKDLKILVHKLFGKVSR